MRIIQEGEATFTISQEEEALSFAAPLALTLNATNKISLFSNNYTTDQINTANPGPHLAVTSTEGLGMFRHTFWRLFIKNMAFFSANRFFTM